MLSPMNMAVSANMISIVIDKHFPVGQKAVTSMSQ